MERLGWVSEDSIYQLDSAVLEGSSSGQPEEAGVSLGLSAHVHGGPSQPSSLPGRNAIGSEVLGQVLWVMGRRWVPHRA